MVIITRLLNKGYTENCIEAYGKLLTLVLDYLTSKIFTKMIHDSHNLRNQLVVNEK